MKEIIILLKRDLKNSLNKRMVLLLGFMVFLQVWFIFGSGSASEVIKTGQMHFMAIVFSFNIFGSIIALALSYDNISAEREDKVLDLILTSGISKKEVLTGKIINGLIVSGVFAAAYILIIMCVYLVMTGNSGISLLTLRYIIPVTVFLFIYNLMGLMLSIIFRSSRTSLIVCAIVGGLMIPRLFLLVVEGLAGILGFGEKTTELLGMISPALIMNALSGYAEQLQIIAGFILFLVYTVVMILLSMVIFTKQDELNYGE